MISQFHLSLFQVGAYIGIWIVIDAIKSICGHKVDWKPTLLLVFFALGLLALGFFPYWKQFLP